MINNYLDLIENSLIDDGVPDNWEVSFHNNELLITAKDALEAPVRYSAVYSQLRYEQNERERIFDLKMLPTFYSNVVVSVTTSSGVVTIIDHPKIIRRENYIFHKSIDEHTAHKIRWYVERHQVLSQFWRAVDDKIREFVMQFKNHRRIIFEWLKSSKRALALCQQDIELFKKIIFSAIENRPLSGDLASQAWAYQWLNITPSLFELDIGNLFMLDEQTVIELIDYKRPINLGNADNFTA